MSEPPEHGASTTDGVATPAPHPGPPAADGTVRDWSAETLRDALDRTTRWLLGYRDRVGSLPVFPRTRPGDIRAALPERAPRGPEPFERVLEDFERLIVPGLTHWNHPGFLAYFASATRGPSVAAELMIAAVGVNAMLWRTSPAATELEVVVVDWLREALGLPGGFRGVILDTASTSSFTALLAARERAGDRVRERGLAGGPPLAAYVSEQAHSSLEKAAIAGGLGRAAVRRIPTDDRFRMDVGALARAIADDRSRGVRPALVGATVGTTSTASVDPVAAIAGVAEEAGAWLHVDAAYAGSAALLPETRGLFEGWERADSIVVNPHKWLGTSLDCSVLLFRDPGPFRESLALTPAYLESRDGEVVNLMDFGLPLGRRFRALKLWVLFRCVGVDGLAASLRQDIERARWFANRIERHPRFRLAAPPSFSTVCFRAEPDGAPPSDARADALNRRVLERVNRRGRVFLSHTELGGRYVLRLSIGSVHTRPTHVEAALSELDAAVEAELGSPGGPGE